MHVHAQWAQAAKRMLCVTRARQPGGDIFKDIGAHQARSSHVARTTHTRTFFFLLTRFLIANATNTKTQMKKNEPSGLLFTVSLLSILGKSGLEVTPLCREATRCKHRYRARAPSRSTSTQLQGLGARSAPRGRVTECGAPVRPCITIMCCACIEKMAPSR